MRQDLTGFDDGGTLKALHGRGGSSPRPPRSPARATVSHPDPDPSHSADPLPFPSCMSTPADYAGSRRRGDLQDPQDPLWHPAMRSAEVPSPSRRTRTRPPAPLQGDFEGFCVQPLDEVHPGFILSVGLGFGYLGVGSRHGYAQGAFGPVCSHWTIATVRRSRCGVLWLQRRKCACLRLKSPSFVSATEHKAEVISAHA